MKVVAIIPAYNEAKYIEDVICGMKHYADKVIVVDDSSTNGTMSKAEKAGAIIVKRSGERGFGYSNRAGIKRALSEDCDIIITLDGDGQHNPEDTDKLIEPIIKGKADIVIGSRFIENNSNIPKYRTAGIKIITFVYNLLCKQKVKDAQCCFRAYRKEVLESIEMTEGGFTFSTEALIKARALGYRIREVPIKVYYHKELYNNSTINPFIQGVSVAWGTLKLRVKVEILDRVKRC